MNIIQWDINTFYAINSISNPLLNLFMAVITHLGSGLFIGTLSLLIFLITKNRELKKIVVLILIGLAIHAILITPVKLAVDRERPPDILKGTPIPDVCEKCPPPKVLEHEWGPSFPSGHAGRLFIIATLLWPSRRKMRKFAYFSILLGIVISISRIYVGMHFPLDVIFGAGFGIVAGYITLLLEKRLEFFSSLYLLQNIFKRAFLRNQIHFHAFFGDGFGGQITNSDDFRVF